MTEDKGEKDIGIISPYRQQKSGLERTLVEMKEPFKGKVYDPCCGSGGMFVQSSKFIKENQGNLYIS